MICNFTWRYLFSYYSLYGIFHAHFCLRSQVSLINRSFNPLYDIWRMIYDVFLHYKTKKPVLGVGEPFWNRFILNLFLSRVVTAAYFAYYKYLYDTTTHIYCIHHTPPDTIRHLRFIPAAVSTEIRSHVITPIITQSKTFCFFKLICVNFHIILKHIYDMNVESAFNTKVKTVHFKASDSRLY